MNSAKMAPSTQRFLFPRTPLLALLALFLVLLPCLLQVDSQKTYSHYPEKIHKLVRQKIDKLYGKNRHHPRGTWDDWQPWWPCSRSCGTGVAMQQRTCLSRAGSKKRSSRVRCVGKDQRFQLCNRQRCAGQDVDFRKQQCKSFNSKVFNQQKYSWEPYIDGGDSCSLNCRPVGLSFYATLNQTVVDGTPCGPAHSQKANRICVQGKCLVVGCDDVLGSGKVVDSCGVCAGDNKTCRIISGVFNEKHLPYGYNLIATLPTGAHNISIYQVQVSNNYLALKELGGRFVVNGPRRRNSAGPFFAAGSLFMYSPGSPTQGDRLYSRGPLRHAMDIMIFHKEINVGIKYEYKMAISSYAYASQPAATHSGISASASRQNRIAIRRPLLMLADDPSRTSTSRNSSNLTHNSVSYNRDSTYGSVQPNARLAEPWKLDASQFVHPYESESANSVQYEFNRQEIRAKNRPAFSNPVDNAFNKNPASAINGPVHDQTTMEKIHHYKKPKTKILTKSNKQKTKHSKKSKSKHKYAWIPNGYTTCSKSCGTGTQATRSTCVRNKNHKAEVPFEFCSNILPVAQEIIECNRQSCPPHWEASEWGACSVTCGLGVQLRNVTCTKLISTAKPMSVHDEQCSSAPSPPVAKVCQLRECDGTADWEVERWTPCSVDCGTGVRRRNVFCSTAHGLVQDARCSQQKPSTEELCDMGSCSTNTWFVSEWENWCNGPCGEGVYKRTVFCSGDTTRDQHTCPLNTKPSTTRPCQPRHHDHSRCHGKWFTAPWSHCDATACTGQGYQYRAVVCVAWERHRYRVLKDQSSCLKTQPKPDDTQACTIPCRSRWLMSEWSQCSASCDGGTQRREIKCFGSDAFGECSRDDQPDSRQACHSQPCKRAKKQRPTNEVPSLVENIQNDYLPTPLQSPNQISHAGACLDRMKNCKLVSKARLCKLQYYSKLCCQTCQH